MSMAGKGNLKLISELLCLNYQTLRKNAQMSDFPEVKMVLADQRIYDVSEVARYMGVPLRSK